MRLHSGIAKDLVTVALVLLLIGAEAALWIDNPMHIPSLFFPARAMGFQLFDESGSAMEPTVAPGRHVLVSAWPYFRGEPRVGDVVAFAYPLDPSVADLKRIVATGGSSVEFRGGVLYVDGKPVAEPYLRGSAARNPDLSGKWLVPAGRFFVLGDNRLESEDSRHYGAIPRDGIIGKEWP